MKRALLAASVSLLCATPAAAATLDQLIPFVTAQYFTWDERHDGRRLLKERGSLFSGGMVAGGSTDFSMTLRGKFEIFGGVVDYNGETQAPDPIAVDTDVSYFGTRSEFDLGYRKSSGGFSIEPFAGWGYRWWLRGLQDTVAASGEHIRGYTEWWQSAYTRLGARARYATSSGLAVFAEGGAKYPFFTGNTVDFEGYGTTTFRPGARWSAFGESGIQYHRLRLALFYEGFRFSQSPLKLVANRHFFQPDSSSDIVGLNIGWSFR